MSTQRLCAGVLVMGAVVATGTPGRILAADSRYAAVPGWRALAPPLKWGEVPNVAIDPKGTVFVFTRAEPPVVELTPAGKLVKTWGQGMFV